MRLTSIIAGGLAALLCSSIAGAQVVTFTGIIQPATTPSICMEETHFLTCTGPDPFSPTGVLLKSSTLNLDTFVGLNARFTALTRGVTCTIYDVTGVQTPPPADLISCGNPVPGCPMRFRVGPAGVIGEYLLFFSLAPTFVPATPTLGTILIAPPFQFLGSGPTTGGPTSAVDIVLPPDTSLTGLGVWVQGARRDVGPIGPWMLTNSLCFRILGPSPPCGPINC